MVKIIKSIQIKQSFDFTGHATGIDGTLTPSAAQRADVTVRIWNGVMVETVNFKFNRATTARRMAEFFNTLADEMEKL